LNIRFHQDGRRLPKELSPDVVIVCPEEESQWEANWDVLSIFGRVWLIHGMGTRQKLAGQGATPLDLAKVKQAAVVVVPNRSRATPTLLGDGDTIQTVRNVQEACEGTEWHFGRGVTLQFLMELNRDPNPNPNPN